MRKLLAVAFAVAAFSAAAEEAPARRVLLAWERTAFKRELMDAMERQLVEKGYAVTRVEHSRRGLDANAADFDAVFITNSGVQSEVRPWIVQWLAANRAQADRILLHTTQIRDWTVRAEVDAVTSASERRDVDRLAADYVARLERLIRAPDAP